jgi:hypothetical protein
VSLQRRHLDCVSKDSRQTGEAKRKRMECRRASKTEPHDSHKVVASGPMGARTEKTKSGGGQGWGFRASGGLAWVRGVIWVRHRPGRAPVGVGKTLME